VDICYRLYSKPEGTIFFPFVDNKNKTDFVDNKNKTDFVDTKNKTEQTRPRFYRIPFMKRTPQALHKVFLPSGPMRHCGVFTVPQCKQPRRCLLPFDMT